MAHTPQQVPMRSSIVICNKYVWNKKTNLHHGRFLFRHKGKKKKGKPNYPPTKMLVKAHRHQRRALPPELKAEIREDLRQARRNWRAAVKRHNQERREKRWCDRHRVTVRTLRTRRRVGDFL